jgi:hypothetical protein
MRNFAARLVMLVVACLALCTCARGRQADKLDRETALSLLRESSEDPVQGPSTWQVDLVVYDTGPAEAARLRFLQSLTPGVIKLTAAGEAEPPGFSAMPSWLEKRKPVQRYEFAPTDPKSVSTPRPGDTIERASFKIASPRYQEVTGIVQEGTRAAATVLVSYTPNALYRTVAAAIANAGPQPGAPWAYLPTEADLARVVRRPAGFRKYDDGWRVKAGLSF